MFSKSKKFEASSDIARAARQIKIEKRRRFWRKARRRILWTLAVLFVAHSSLHIYASVLLNRELAAIRENGDPLRFSEIEPPALPDARNAARVYERATKSLRFSPEEKYALQATRLGASAGDKKRIESAVANNRQALELARQAAAMPQCRFPLDWKSDPTNFLFPHYAQVRQLARLLAMNAEIQARRGNGAAALDDARALFGMAHHLSNEPYLIGFLVAQSVDALAHRALGEALKVVPLSVAQAHELEASLPKDDWTKAFRRSLVGERMMGIFAFESLGKTSSNTANEDEDSSGIAPFALVWTRAPLLWVSRPVIKMDEVQTLRMWRQMLDSPGSQQVPRSVAFGQAQDAAVDNAPFYAMLTKILFPVFSQASDHRDYAEVRRRQREVALALACFRTARGHYPALLSQAETVWKTPLPLDPYSQKPFIYRLNGKDFTLYSVGVNRTDDGGVGPYSQGKNFVASADDLAWLRP